MSERMSMTLGEWQARFREALTAEGSWDGLFAPAPGLDARFAVYRDGRWIRVGESLEEDFPLTARLLGRVGFPRALRAFLRESKGNDLELGEASPRFAAFLRARRGLPPTLGRALAIDLLAVAARRAPEPEASVAFSVGLHPSVRLLVEGERAYALWRRSGVVRRERISPRLARLLEAFRPAGAPEEIAARLERLGEDPAFAESAVGEGTACGWISVHGPMGQEKRPLPVS